MYKQLLFFVLLTQFAFAQSHEGDDIKAIKASRAASNSAIAKHDINGISKYWLTGFVQTSGKGISITGAGAVIASWKELFKANATVAYVRSPVAVVIGDNGIMAWETGTWIAKNSYSKGGNYSAMWRKIDGKWKLQAELFVSLKKFE